MNTDPELEEYTDLDSTEVSDQDADKEYEVEKILASKQVNGQDRYLVQWKGYQIDRSTWEPVESFNDPNTVLEWRKTAARQKKGLEQEFDWREWDRQRLEDERKTIKRRHEREIKRQESGWYRRRTYRSESELDGFVVSDDAILSDEEGVDVEDDEATSSSSSEGEVDPLERIRKRKKAPLSHESDDTSDDSLMRSAQRKHRTKKRLKFRRKHGHASDRELDPKSPKGFTDRARIEKRKRAASPSEALSGAARNLSLESFKHEKMKNHDADRQIKKQKLQAGIKIVTKPPRPGPSRKQKKVTDPSQVRVFSSLSHVNRIYKQGQVEPPPDISKLNLFNPGQPARVLPPIPRRASISQISAESTVPSRERASSPSKVNKSILYANYKIPKRKSIPVPPNDDDDHLFLDPSSRMDNDTAGSIPCVHRVPNVREGVSIDSSIPHTLSPEHMMEIDSTKPVNPRLFVCNLEHGPRATFIGEAKFTGFSTTFVEELYNKPDCRALWISKFYGQNYVKEYFAPHYGHVLQDATIEIDPDQVQPLVNALAFLKGAGVVLHPDFTMLIFLPSNTDLDRKAFKLPQLPATGTNKIKPSLRAVVYPALEGTAMPSRNSGHESQNRDIMRAIDSLPSWEKDLQYSLPAYLANTANCNWTELLGVEKEGIERSKGKESKETSFVFLYPPIAESESKEYKQALECFNRKIVDLKYLRNHLQAGHAMVGFTVLIHQSLRRHLHLLPDIVRDHNKEARNYWLYGTKLEERNIEEKPQKIWPSGSLIFMTPQLIASSPEGYKDFLAYANRKAATTKLALPSVWEERVMEAMRASPSEEVLNGVFEIKRKIESGTIILISVDLHDNCTELDTYIDIFALYQLENPFDFRRFGFGHTTLPDTGTLELFSNIWFLTPEILSKNHPEIRKPMIKPLKEQENKNKQGHAQSSSSGSAVKRDLPQGPERRP